MPLKLKEEAKKTYIAFGNSTKVLGERSDNDLRDLAILAHQSQNPRLLDLFDELPSLADLQTVRTAEEKKAIPVAAPVEKPKS